MYVLLLLLLLLTPWSRVLLEKLTGFAANQEIPRILWNPKVHYRTHKGPLSVASILISSTIYRSQCSEYPTGWTVRGSKCARDKKWFSSPTRPDWFRGPPSSLSPSCLSPSCLSPSSLSPSSLSPSSLFSGYRCAFPVVKCSGREVNYLHLVVRSKKKRGAVPLLHLYAFIAWTWKILFS